MVQTLFGCTTQNVYHVKIRHFMFQTLVHVHLVSRRAEERQDAAKHLGLLRCGDAMVFFALKERLRSDEDSRVRYEAAKSLILLGKSIQLPSVYFHVKVIYS